MKKKSLIGLLLTVALLCVAMVVQLVSAMSEEDLLKPGDLVTVNYKDYYLKTVKAYVDGNLQKDVNFKYDFLDDGSIKVTQDASDNGLTYSIIKKEYA